MTPVEALARYRQWERSARVADDRTVLLVRLLAAVIETSCRQRVAERPGPVGGSNAVMSMRSAASYVGVAYSTFQRHYRADWKIPHYRVGNRVQFRQRDLDGWMAGKAR